MNSLQKRTVFLGMKKENGKAKFATTNNDYFSIHTLTQLILS
ncbi:hypothetical protein LEP1GSC017_2862 [Leptospira meyeri serovar Hardjo str. Went 5]|nr:hypothetical protein LEP1GSC017_2862 [Leptospira meyeri serovar Hardjo str. Went 5]